MMLPILIVVSVAPGLYVFCAAAGWAMASAAMTAAESMYVLRTIVSSLRDRVAGPIHMGSVRRGRGRRGADPAASSASEDLADQDPGLAVELLELHLLDREEIGWAGVDGDPRQQHRRLDVLEVRRLLHHVLARQ